MFRRKDESGELQLDTDVLVEEEAGIDTSSAAPAAPIPAPRPAMPMASATPAARPASPLAAQPYRPLSSAASSHSPAPSQASSPSEFRPMPASPLASNTTSSSSAPKAAGKRVLTVGNDILLKGEIATCDRLVIEGAVDAVLKEVHTVEIAEHGSFKGTAEIEDAEISGIFEGDLIVRNRLTIYSTGKVRGRIAYGEIEIERGGELSGEITFGRPEAGSRGKRAAA
jgi:cytoskeletal protein CcmA (bactofilin family)